MAKTFAERRKMHNESAICRETGAITLTSGAVCFVDPDDIDLVSHVVWSEVKSLRTSYAYGFLPGSEVRLFMHVLLMGQRDGFMVDHRDGNGLNNVRSNLRWATSSQNQANKRHQRGNSNPYKGVWPPTGEHPHWRAGITCDGVRYYLGNFATPEEAALAYDRKAKELFGEFAKLNFEESRDS